MDIRELLKEERDEYWNDEWKDSVFKIEDCLLKYQKYEECSSKVYIIKLVAKLDKDGDFEILCKINDTLICFDEDGYMNTISEKKPVKINWFHCVRSLLKYSSVMEDKLTDDGFEPIYRCDEEFELAEGEENVILSVCIDVD